MRKATIFIVVALLLTLCSVPVYAADMPPLPHAFYGDLTLNGSAAPAGTRIEARGEGVETGTYNPITTTESGKYGSADPLGAKLIVQGDISEGTTITFYVNGTSTGQTYPFDSGETTDLPLSVTITAPPPPPPPTVETTLFGIEGSFPISDEGVIEEEIVATSEDGDVTITIEEGTIALDKDGEPLETLTADVDTNPPDPPEGDNIIGLVYDFGPEGATFEPPITITFNYDPDEVSEGAELVVMVWDEDAAEWVKLDEEDYSVNTETNTVTVLVSGFSKYAIIAHAPPPTPTAPAAFSVSSLTVTPVEVEPGDTVTITVLVANTGGESGSYAVVLKIDGVKEAEETVTIAAGSSQTVTFSVTGEEAGSYTVAVDGLSGSFTVVAPPSRINWPMIGGIIGGVVVVGLLIFFFVRRRAY
jgi:hypothetical protein